VRNIHTEAKVGSRDLRLKLQKKASQQSYQGGRESGVRDLREKLSGTVNSRPANVNQSKAKAAPAPAAPAPAALESAKPVRKSAPSTEATVADTKKVSAPASSSKKSQKMVGEPLDSVTAFIYSISSCIHFIIINIQRSDIS